MKFQFIFFFFFFEKVSIEFMFTINRSPYNIKCTEINTIKQFIYRVKSRRMNSIGKSLQGLLGTQGRFHYLN